MKHHDICSDFPIKVDFFVVEVIVVIVIAASAAAVSTVIVNVVNPLVLVLVHVTV